ncbi:MAG: fimbrillin family protein [Alistipes sp.]|nr:fimbrillin family protein [Alistipes sp.]
MINAKQIIRAAVLVMGAFAVASCSKDGLVPDTPGGGTTVPGGEIIFDIGFAPLTRVATGTDFTSNWEEGDAIGIFACASGTTLAQGGNYIHNVKLTYSGGSWKLDDGVELWHLPSGGKLDFYAYHPYDAAATDPTAIAFNVAADQNAATTVALPGGGSAERPNYNLSDLLTARSDNGGSGWGKGQTVSLQFSHALAMVEVSLDNESGGIDPNVISVKLQNVKPGATLNLGGTTGPQVELAAADNEPTAIKMYRVEQEGTPEYRTTFTFRALVPAQELKQDSRPALISNGEQLLQSSALTGDIMLQAAQAEQFTQIIPISAISAQPEANSYMARPYGQALLIPVSQANRVLNGEDLGASIAGLNTVTTGDYTVELVWADTPIGDGGVVTAAGPVEIDGEGYLLVKPGIEGNAVIGIKLNGELDYRWSWHIWVTEPVTSATDTETGLTWMDRNLGAAVAGLYDPDGRNGLFYQWGRKDAFPAGDGTGNNQTYYTPDHPSGTTDNLPTGTYTELPGMVQNPLNFATNNSTYYGSVNQSGDQNNSWGGVSGGKTAYDPCPPGWKMPPILVSGTNSWGNSGDWGSFTDKGRVFNGVNSTADLNHYYPASGFRNLSSGFLQVQGTYGRYWSTTAQSATYGYALYFNSGSVNPANANNRAYGFSVRCVAE